MQVKLSDIFELMLYISIVITCMSHNNKIKLIFCVLEVISLIAFIVASKFENRKKDEKVFEELKGDEQND